MQPEHFKKVSWLGVVWMLQFFVGCGDPGPSLELLAKRLENHHVWSTNLIQKMETIGLEKIYWPKNGSPQVKGANESFTVELEVSKWSEKTKEIERLRATTEKFGVKGVEKVGGEHYIWLGHDDYLIISRSDNGIEEFMKSLKGVEKGVPCGENGAICFLPE